MIARILVIDDIYGWAWNGKNRKRDNFCGAWRLNDVSENYQSSELPPKAPVAEAVFHSGQQLIDGVMHNDIHGTLDFIRQGWENMPHDKPRWSLLLLDLHFKTGAVDENGQFTGPQEFVSPANTDYFGLKLYEAISADPGLKDLPILILSAMERKPLDKARRIPANVEFLDKNVTAEEFRKFLNTHGLFESGPLTVNVQGNEQTRLLIGRSLPFLKCLRDIRRACELGNDNVLLLGESGTGKEVFARYAHAHSPKCNGMFIPLDLQRTPENLIEDKLFGHEKGAFDGAQEPAPGAAEQANEGTLFIDEFGDMPDSAYSKLLRLLEKDTRETQRIGPKATPKRLDIQVVLATNNTEMLSNPDYQRNFTRRVHNIIRIPSLEERKEDIELLTTHFLRQFENEYGAEEREITHEALLALRDYPWAKHGNVGKLRELLENAVKNHKTQRLLHKVHLNLVETAYSDESLATKPTHRFEELPISTQPATAADLDHLLAQFAEFRFDSLPFSELCQLEGKLNDITDAYIKLVISYLEAALQKEGGKITPAMKFVYGKEYGEKLTSTDAKRRFLDLLGLGESLKLTLPSVTPLDRNSLVFETLREYPPKLEANRLTPKGKRTTWDLFLEKRGFSLSEIEELRQAKQANQK